MGIFDKLFSKPDRGKADSPSTERRKESAELTVPDWAFLERNLGHDKHVDGPVP
jgi:hypothetical protein